MDRSPRPVREVNDRPESSPRPQVEQARPRIVERPAVSRPDPQPVRVQEQPRREVRQNVESPRQQAAPATRQGNSRGEGQHAAKQSDARHNEEKKK
jgi:hypothetical protein